MPVHSGRAYPIQAGHIADLEVERGIIPYWLAVLAYNQMRKAGVESGELNGPSIDQIERMGGLLPMPFLDLLAGGNGTGTLAAQIYSRNTTLMAAEMIFTPVKRGPNDKDPTLLSQFRPGIVGALAWSKSGRAFPIQGGRVGDGTGVDKGTIPYWLAVIVFNQMCKSIAESSQTEVITLERIEKAGGFCPLPFLDLLAGGNGAGIMAGQLYQRKNTLLAEPMPLEKIGVL